MIFVKRQNAPFLAYLGGMIKLKLSGIRLTTCPVEVIKLAIGYISFFKFTFFIIKMIGITVFPRVVRGHRKIVCAENYECLSKVVTRIPKNCLQKFDPALCYTNDRKTGLFFQAPSAYREFYIRINKILHPFALPEGSFHSINFNIVQNRKFTRFSSNNHD